MLTYCKLNSDHAFTHYPSHDSETHPCKTITICMPNTNTYIKQGLHVSSLLVYCVFDSKGNLTYDFKVQFSNIKY